MAKKNVYADWSNEELIIAYALDFYDETKKRYAKEQAILKELANRGVIDLDKMNELYKQKAL